MMRSRYISILLILLLVCTSDKAMAWRRYKYCKAHSCMDGCYKDKHFRPFHSWKNDPSDNRNKEMEGHYYHTYKNYDRHDGVGYYKYYDNHNKIYYDPGYKDNYRAEVDGNK